MSRRAAAGTWFFVVVLSAVAGVAVAGLPEFGSSGQHRLSAAPGGAPPTTATASTSAPPTTTTSTTSTTEAAPEQRPIGTVTVIVANGTSTTGLAGRWTTQLQDLGWDTIPAIDGIDTRRTEIWFAPTYRPEGAALAEMLGISLDELSPMPATSPIDHDTANLVLLIGEDLAD